MKANISVKCCRSHSPGIQNSASEANIKAETHVSTISFSDAYVGDTDYPVAALDYLANNIKNYNSGAHSITSVDSRGTGILLCKLYGESEYYVGILIPKYIGKLPLVFAHTSGTYSLLQFKWCDITDEAISLLAQSFDFLRQK